MIGIKRDNVSLPIRINLDEELIEVIGLFIAEGHLRKKIFVRGEKGFYQISIASSDENLREFIKNLVMRFKLKHLIFH